jgi:heme exporter protein A
MADLWLEARNLTRVYARRAVIQNVSFRSGQGELWAVLGPNGSGKSTLLRLLAGLLRPTSGESEVRCAAGAFKGPDRRSVVGLVSPEISTYEELDGLENLEFAASLRGLPCEPAVLRESLESVGLGLAARQRTGSYSSGMKQRLKLALAVQHSPAVLLLDEPMALLDEGGRGLVRELVGRQLRHGLVIWATNDVSELPAERHEIQLAGTQP